MSKPWYADGLRFSCTQCGKCCGGSPGYVWVSEDEIWALADHLGLDQAAFRRRYVRKVYKRGYTLVEKPNYDCIFWDKQSGCTVYELRPRQCRTWPFWRSNCATQEEWEAAAEDCPGMDRGTLHSQTAIEASLDNDGLL